MRIQMKAVGSPVAVRGTLLIVNPKAQVGEDAFSVKFDVPLSSGSETVTSLTFFTNENGMIFDRTFGLGWSITNQ